MRCFIRSGGLTSFGEIMQALVLAGGRSSRMGRDKSLIQINGKSLIRITLERLIDSGHSSILVMASDEDQELFGNLLAWVTNYNQYIMSQWNENVHNHENVDASMVESFIDITTEEKVQ